MRIEPYLFLNGRCDEAIGFYEGALGATRGMLMRFDDNPTPHQGPPLPAGWGGKVMHAELHVGQTLVMVSDGMSDTPAPMQGSALSISADDEASARRMFGQLADGGQVVMPLGPTFWSPCFGMVNDRFGVAWMLGVDGPPPDA